MAWKSKEDRLEGIKLFKAERERKQKLKDDQENETRNMRKGSRKAQIERKWGVDTPDSELVRARLEAEKIQPSLPPEKLDKLSIKPLRDAISTGSFDVPENFETFLDIVGDAEYRADYPTNADLANKLGISIPTLKAWMMTAEAAKAIEISVTQNAKLAVPGILTSMVREANAGDSKAAGVVIELAKMGKKQEEEKKATQTLEQAMAGFVMGRIAQSEIQASKEPKTIDAKVEN